MTGDASQGREWDDVPGESGDARGVPSPSTCPAWLQLEHELRTPLNAILGNAELLLDGSAGPLSGQARRCLTDLQAAGQQLMAQVRLMLLLLQTSTPRAPALDPTVDFLLLMRRALARSSARITGLEVRPDDAALLVRADPSSLDALAQAVTQVVSEDSVEQDLAVRIDIAPARQCDAQGLRMCITWTAFDLDRLPAVALLLIDTVLRSHGGRAWPVAGRGLYLHWPQGRAAVG